MTTIYGIKNCDTCRKALKWLDSQGINHQFHDLRIDGVEAEMITKWLEAVGLDALVNKRSTTWRTLDEATKEGLNAETAIPLLKEQPTLMKRPIIVTEKATTVGFTKAVQESLSA